MPPLTLTEAKRRLESAKRAECYLRLAYADAKDLRQLRPRIKATLKSAQGAVRHALGMYLRTEREG